MNEAVKQHRGKSSADFMFALADEEFAALRSQTATSNAGRGGRRCAPRVFTEHGALMAATVLNSPRAVEIWVYVVRAFVRLRNLPATLGVLGKRLMNRNRQPKSWRRTTTPSAATATATNSNR